MTEETQQSETTAQSESSNINITDILKLKDTKKEKCRPMTKVISIILLLYNFKYVQFLYFYANIKTALTKNLRLCYIAVNMLIKFAIKTIFLIFLIIMN